MPITNTANPSRLKVSCQAQNERYTAGLEKRLASKPIYCVVAWELVERLKYMSSILIRNIQLIRRQNDD